ncbi:MAG: ATP-binding protein, partial [Bacteroidota bacterium]
MKQLYTRLVNLGIQEGMDPAERRAIGLINRISLMGICIFLSLSIIPYFFNYDLVSLFTGTINIASFSFCIWLNHKRYYLAAKHFLMVFGIGIVSYVNLLMPPSSYGPMNYIPIVLIPSMIFKDKKWVFIYPAITLICFLATWYAINEVIQFSEIPESIILFSSTTNIIVNMFVVGFLLQLFYRGLQEEYEAVLIQKNELLEEQNLQIKQAQTQLVQSEKMASLGQLTAGIAHEINNPINFVSGNVSPMKRDIKEIDQWIAKSLEGKRPEEIQEIFEEIYELIGGIEEGAVRTKEIVQGLRNFSRLDEDDKKIANVHEGIDSTLTLLTHKTPSNTRIHKSYGEIPPISCYPGKLNQVFMNILSNALDATEEKGDIFIQTGWKDEGNQLIQITFQDTGCGMSPKAQTQVFEPFFTTKDVGKGTGLGMSIAYGIIQQHGGTIEVSSKEGEGSEFRVC